MLILCPLEISLYYGLTDTMLVATGDIHSCARSNDTFQAIPNDSFLKITKPSLTLNVITDKQTNANALLKARLTRSSPQWWLGRSTTTHIVLNLLSLILGFGERYTIVHCITSQPANVSRNALHWNFHQPQPDGWNLTAGFFDPPLPVWQARGDVGDRG